MTARQKKYLIPGDYAPAEATYKRLRDNGISREFAKRCIDPFVLYFADSKIMRPGWEKSFFNWVTKDFEKSDEKKLKRYKEWQPEKVKVASKDVARAALKQMGLRR